MIEQLTEVSTDLFTELFSTGTEVCTYLLANLHRVIAHHILSSLRKLNRAGQPTGFEACDNASKIMGVHIGSVRATNR